WLACAGPVSAGIYCTDKDVPDKRFVPSYGPPLESSGIQAIPYKEFQLALAEVIDLRNPAKTDPKSPTLRDKFLKRKEELQQKVRESGTLEDHINLSAYLLWLGDYQPAIDLLKPLADDERRNERNFRVFANLGTVYQITGNNREAGFFLI